MATKTSAAQAAKSTKTQEIKPSGRLHVAARVDGFRRCGRAWPATGMIVERAEFSDDDIARLKAEPELIVADLDD